MEDIKLTYSKDWRNPADFPTVEPDEKQVRADMQLLYSEIQTFLNETLIPAMKTLEYPPLERLPVEHEVSGSTVLIPTSAAVSRLFASNGNLPTGGAAGQFLVKTSDAYADSRWATFRIPERASDLVALNGDGEVVNAQALLTELSLKAYRNLTDVITPETLATGTLGNGTTINLENMSDYEVLWITLSCGGRASLNPAAVYLGRWNGAWITDADGVRGVDETGMLLLSSVVFSEDSRTDFSAELTMLPFSDGHLVRWLQGMRSDDANYHDGLFICPISSSGVPDQTKLTMFSSSVIAADGSGDTPVTYGVYGIRRKTLAEV